MSAGSDTSRRRERPSKADRAQPPQPAPVEPQNRSQDAVHTAADLHLACDALIQRTRVHIEVDGQIQWHHLPSLLEQLAGEDARTGQGGAATTGSRPTINTGIVGLLSDIATISRRQLGDLKAADHGTDMVRNVRAATTATALTADPAEIAMWLYVLTGWRHAARRELQLDSSRRQWLRGIACPQCGATTALSSGARARERMQTSALAVTWAEPQDGQAHVEHEWRWEAVDCRACGASWWRGVNMHHLIAALRDAGVIGAEWSAVTTP